MRKRQGKELNVTSVLGGKRFLAASPNQNRPDRSSQQKNWKPLQAARSFSDCCRPGSVHLFQHSHVLFVRTYLGKQFSELLDSFHRQLCGLHFVVAAVSKNVAFFFGFAGVLSEWEDGLRRLRQFIHLVPFRKRDLHTVTPQEGRVDLIGIVPWL